jgi:hypothetical protein
MIKGIEFHSIIGNIFPDTKGLGISEQLQTCCPRCQEEQGLSYPDGKFNLEINTAKGNGTFHCWSCEPKFSGSLKRLIYLYGSKSDYDLFKSYATIYTNNYSYENNDDEQEFIQIRLPEEMILFSKMEEGNSEHFEAYNYLVNERKISREIILKYRFGFCTTGKYAKRIIVPSYDGCGDITYFIGRSYNPKERKMKYKNPPVDKNKIIFNEGFINWDSTVFLCEGVFDAFSLPNAIPLLGKTLSVILFNKLNELKPNIIVLLDPDAIKNAINLYQTLHTIYVGCEDRIRIVELPIKEDIDRLRKDYGIEKVIETLYTARKLNNNDCFINKLTKPYDNSSRAGKGRYDSYSKYFEWKSTSARKTI